MLVQQYPLRYNYSYIRVQQHPSRWCWARYHGTGRAVGRAGKAVRRLCRMRYWLRYADMRRRIAGSRA
eukprot:911420-Rhodomonas_salina.5